MELIAAQEPEELHAIFDEKFAGKHTWTNKKSEPGEHVVHITRKTKDDEAPETAVVQTFDARPFPPAERHERVFNAFDALKTGQAFVFTNDHDPKPLYYQLEAESLHPFLWEYLESGPEVWKVRVARVG
jgi:uncharacterized protein (DUF2249 family)